MHTIDLRSDTVTQPTPPMRNAMAMAAVGDNVIDIDPTVRQLEDFSAELLGKEDAIFMPSGTMTNQIALRVHCQPGDDFLCEEYCHIYNWEQGAFAQLSGLVARTVLGTDGIFDIEHLEGKVRVGSDHCVRTRLVCLENTHNRGGGRVWPYAQAKRVCDWARSQRLMLHLDGARLFNAVVSSGVPARDWSSLFDTVSICLSKGLGAPVGSVLAGSKEFIATARRARKLFGGGMRQAGIIAAGGLFALQNHIPRLQLDHAHAQQLADAVSNVDGIELTPQQIDSNIVIFRLGEQFPAAAEVVRDLENAGVRGMSVSDRAIRLVTHLDVDANQISRACQILSDRLTTLSQHLRAKT